ncbi:MAG TPA: SusC/RagA family TonB-linked outer membrane protein [Longimicrobiales bacterium]
MSKFRSLGVLLLGLALPTSLAAQATITGRVTSGSGTPLQSVSVFIQGLNVGTLTGPDGSYSFQVPAARFTTGQQVQLLAQLIGYRAEAHTVSLSSGQTVAQNFTLQLDPLRLTEVVATGSGTEARRERLGSAVASVSPQTIQRANEPNVVAALSGKVPGVRTTYGGGDAGASVAIQIRGPKSFGGSQPAIIVDGVPANNNNRQGSALGGSGTGTPAPNRAVDINPEDIESIEILKGAAATSIYGAAAGSAGAILITTKRGRAGRTSYTLRSTYQQDEAIKYLPVQRTYGMGLNGATPAGVVLTGDDMTCATQNCVIGQFFSWGPVLPAGTTTYDHAAEVFENGRIWDNTLSMSGGNERTTFYLSLGGFDHNGFVYDDRDYFKRYSVRFNGSHALMDNLTIGASGQYTQTKGSGADRGNGLGGIGLSALRQPAEFNARKYLTDEGLHRSWRFPNPGPSCASTLAASCTRGFDNPFYGIYENENTQETGRYFGSVTANWRPISWLQLNYTLGGDYTSDDRMFAAGYAASGTAAGSLNRWQFYDRIIDSNLNATGTWQLNNNVITSLTVGQNLNETYFRQVDVTGTTWIAPRPYKLSNTTNRTVPNDSESRRRLEGYFAQATVDLYDQLFLQGRIRNDGSSAFGIGNQRAWYPGGSVAWSFTKTLNLPENVLTFGKLRLAYGESGQQPGLYQQQDVFAAGAFADFSPGSLQVPTLNGIGGLYPSATRGNPDIAPERVRELEMGFDLNLLRGRVDFGLTRYMTKSEDVIFGVGLPPSTGYTQVSLNAGELENKGWEIVANFRPIMREGFSIEFGANWAKNNNLVTSLGAITAQLDGLVDMPTPENCGAEARVPRCQIGFGSSFSGQTTHAQVGYSLGTWRAADFARCGRGLTTVSFGGSTHDVGAACQGAPDGALYIAANGFPITDGNVRAIGNPEPDWTAGLSAVINFRGVELSAFVDHRKGGDILNMTRASMYQYGTHKDTEIRGETRTFGQDMLCHNKTCDVLNGPVVGPGAGTAVVIGQGWFNGGPLGSGQGAVGGPISQRLEDGTHTRLREVSIAYSFRDAWVQKLAGTRQLDVKFSGRNLGLWTDYSGLDPETNLGGAANANRGIDWFSTPMSRAWIVSVALHH